jgi:WXG100 family type VII secretion target
MAWKTITNKRSVSLVPPEAMEIAASFRAAAEKIRQLSSTLRTTGTALDTMWEGNSKQHFMDAYNPQPGNLESYAMWLESTADQIESITVTTEETYTETVWEPDAPPSEE